MEYFGDTVTGMYPRAIAGTACQFGPLPEVQSMVHELTYDPVPDTWTCPHCGKARAGDKLECSGCGYVREI